MNIMNNSFYNNNDNQIKLYNSVFNNSYLKRIIFNHLNLFNILSKDIIFETIEEWQQFKYKEYLNIVTIEFPYDLNQLPENIKHVNIRPETISATPLFVKVPHQIESIGFLYFTTSRLKIINLESNRELNNNKLILSTNRDQLLEPNIIPSSITNLTLSGAYGLSYISRNVLPINLKRLSSFGIDSFEDGCFPKSLTDVKLKSSASVINQFTNNLVRLEFRCDSDILSNIRFPNSLEYLELFCKTFNTPLPERLKTIKLILDYHNYQIKFPPSLEKIKVYVSRRQGFIKIFKDRHSVPPNLKKLEFPCTSLVDMNGYPILPKQLEKLQLSGLTANVLFNQTLESYQLPSSLTYLCLGQSFNLPIDQNVLPSGLTYLDLGTAYQLPIGQNVLPSSLKTLILGYLYSQPIDPKAMPHHLKVLDIDNPDYEEPLNLNPHTLITRVNFKVFYKKYSTSPEQLCVLKLPGHFNKPLSKLQLQNKSNLEYLHLGSDFSHEIQLSDLPIQNNIKTLVLSSRFNGVINLEYFKKLETLIIQRFNGIKLTSTINQYGVYDTYSLKFILVDPHNINFIKNLDISFYHLLKRMNKKII